MDITYSLNYFKFVLFADDSTLSIWLVANKICINASKTKYMLFSYKKGVTLTLIKIGHHKIHKVEYTNFLGIYFDKRLN